MALDDPAQSEEGGAGENGGAPSVGVPFAVLPYGVPPLILEHRRVRVHLLRRVPVIPPPTLIQIRQLGFRVSAIVLICGFVGMGSALVLSFVDFS